MSSSHLPTNSTNTTGGATTITNTFSHNNSNNIKTTAATSEHYIEQEENNQQSILLTVTQASSHNLNQYNNSPQPPTSTPSNVHTNNLVSNNNSTVSNNLQEKQNHHHHTRHGSNVSGLSNQSINNQNNHNHHHSHAKHHQHSNTADETTFTSSPLADLLSQMDIYNWDEFVRNMTHYHHGSRTNSFLTNASSSITPTNDSTPNQINGHLAPPTSQGVNTTTTTTGHDHSNHHSQAHTETNIHLPSATATTDIPRMTLSKLSRYYSIVLVVRRYVKHGGCGFCNRRIVELVNWFKSLLQIGIIPIVLHAESEEDGNDFFHHFKNPNIAHIPRVSDPKYELSSTLLKMSGSSPLVFKEFSLMDGLKIVKDYKSAVKEGYTLEKHAKDKVFEESTQQLVPKMLLIKNNQVVHVWDHGFGEGAPDILSTVILKLPWLVMTTSDMLSGGRTAGGDLTDLHTRGSISSNVTDIELKNNYLGIPTNVTRKISGGGEGGSPTAISRKISNTSNNHLNTSSNSYQHGHYLGTSVESSTGRRVMPGSSPMNKGSPKPHTTHIQTGSSVGGGAGGGNSIQYYLDQLSTQQHQPKDHHVVDSTDDMEQDAFNVTSPTDNGGDQSSKQLLSPSKKVQSSEELLIEDIKLELIPDIPTAAAVHTPRSVSDSTSTTGNNMFDLSRLRFKPLTYFRKVEGVVDFEEVSQEQLREEDKIKTEQAKIMLKKKQKRSFSCFSRPESSSLVVEEYSSDIASIKVNLQSILLDDNKRQYFKIFAMKEFNAENIFFWEDVHLIYKKLFLELHKLAPTQEEELREKIQHTATYLTNKYFLDEMSLFILNTSNNLKHQVINQTRSADYFTSDDDCKFLYDDVLMEIMTTVLPDMYYRFVASNQYQEMIKELRRSR